MGKGLILLPAKLDCPEDWTWFQDHPFTPPKRAIVNGSMLVSSEVSKIQNSDLQEVLLDCPPDHPEVKDLVEHPWKDRDYLNLHAPSFRRHRSE